MSKKKGKAANKAVKQAAKKPVKKAAPARASKAAAMSLAGPDLRVARTRNATILVFKHGDAVKIRTSPQRLYANPGDSVAWTVVNMSGKPDQDVTITWDGDDGPWGPSGIQVQGWHNKKVVNPASRRYKYTVTGYGTAEDPELEIPEM